MEKIKERLIANSTLQGGCWIWNGRTMPNGYARPTIAGKKDYAHRLSYIAFCGPIAPGLCVCHTCDVRNCVNPEHLWLGTKKENTLDMIRKGRRTTVPIGKTIRMKFRKRYAPKSGKPSHLVLTYLDAKKIREMHSQGVRSIDIAREFKIHKTTVCGIVKGRSWKRPA